MIMFQFCVCMEPEMFVFMCAFVVVSLASSAALVLAPRCPIRTSIEENISTPLRSSPALVLAPRCPIRTRVAENISTRLCSSQKHSHRDDSNDQPSTVSVTANSTSIHSPLVNANTDMNVSNLFLTPSLPVDINRSAQRISLTDSSSRPPAITPRKWFEVI